MTPPEEVLRVPPEIVAPATRSTVPLEAVTWPAAPCVRVIPLMVQDSVAGRLHQLVVRLVGGQEGNRLAVDVGVDRTVVDKRAGDFAESIDGVIDILRQRVADSDGDYRAIVCGAERHVAGPGEEFNRVHLQR